MTTPDPARALAEKAWRYEYGVTGPIAKADTTHFVAYVSGFLAALDLLQSPDAVERARLAFRDNGWFFQPTDKDRAAIRACLRAACQRDGRVTAGVEPGSARTFGGARAWPQRQVGLLLLDHCVRIGRRTNELDLEAVHWQPECALPVVPRPAVAFL